MAKGYVAQCKDANGLLWEFEGYVGGIPIWVKQGESKPLIMTESDAQEILDNEIEEYLNEEGIIKEIL
jgi:hypothetical protein